MSAPEDHFEPEDMPHHLGGGRRVGGWQPIETAPKDGTVIDVWVEERFAPGAPYEPRRYRKTNVRWRKSMTASGACRWCWDYDGSAQDVEHLVMGGFAVITHWAPLPEPPESLP